MKTLTLFLVAFTLMSSAMADPLQLASVNSSLALRGEPVTQEETLRLIQHELHREYGVRTERQIDVLDDLANLYIGERRQEDAFLTSRAAFYIRLEHAQSSDAFYSAYQTFGDALTGAGYLQQAAEVFRDGSHLPEVKPAHKVNLLVSLARLGLIDRNFLRWSTKSMIRAREISAAHDLAEPQLLDLGFADLLMVGGDVEAAGKLYRALWQAEPAKREDWFGRPTLLFASGALEDAQERVGDQLAFAVTTDGSAREYMFTEAVDREDRKVLSKWLKKSVYRPMLRDGELLETQVSLLEVDSLI